MQKKKKKVNEMFSNWRGDWQASKYSNMVKY